MPLACSGDPVALGVETSTDRCSRKPDVAISGDTLNTINAAVASQTSSGHPIIASPTRHDFKSDQDGQSSAKPAAPRPEIALPLDYRWRGKGARLKVNANW